MKRNVIFILMILTSAELSFSQCQWMVQRGPDPATRSAICFVDSLHGWVGRSPNYRDGMLRTTNGGRSWDTVNFTFNIGAVGSISFIDTLRGWCSVPSLSKIYRTVDGGITWSELFWDPDYRAYVVNLQFVDSVHGWSVGPDTTFPWTRVRRTTDGGKSWISYQIKTSAVYYRMEFVDSLQGWLAGEELYATSDGGVTWQRQTYSDSVGGLYGVSFINHQTGWCCAARNGWIIHTTDGGLTWANQFSINPPNGISQVGISFVDTLNGWAFGYTFYQGDVMELINRTSDGGKTWFQESIGLSRYLENGTAIDRCHAWAISSGDGSILGFNQITDVTGTEFSVPGSIQLFQNYPNPFNPSTEIEYALSHREHVSIKVYDNLGQEIANILDEVIEAGVHRLHFDASGFPSGIYYFHLITPTAHQVQKSILVR